MRWTRDAVYLVSQLDTSSISTGYVVTPPGAIDAILAGGPGSSKLRHAILELRRESGYQSVRRQPRLSSPAELSPLGIDPLEVEHLVEEQARSEGVHVVAERHVAAFMRQEWGQALAILGIDPDRLYAYARDAEIGPAWFREETANAWHGLLDANIIIEAKNLEQINWKRETGSKDVTLWISSSLLDELDRLRFHHKDRRTKKRTQALARRLVPAMANSWTAEGIPIRDGAKLRVYVRNAPTGGLDPDHIAAAIEMQDGGVPIHVVTFDLGVQARAHMNGLPVLVLSDECRLPPRDTGDDGLEE